ncbi:unnamed protein product, partial [Mesorhabditis belari]|uniref:Receptor expression-enhancing protein n=1 Tax=Mesorhabditis belari TaxID=2138241 RepID=A0AAF3FIF9_9BILA
MGAKNDRNPKDDIKLVHGDLLDFLYASHGRLYDAMCQNLEKTGVKREQASYGLFVLLGLYLIFGSLAQFVCNLIGFAYPAYASVKAIRTAAKDDDTQWLIYWTVFAFFSLIDFFTGALLKWFPFYYVVKTIFLIYLSLPQTQGALYLYNKIIDPAITLFDKCLNARLSGESAGAEGKAKDA